MKCKECGSDMLSTDRFCGICGAPNTPAQQNPNADSFSDILYEPEASAPVFNNPVADHADKPIQPEPPKQPEPASAEEQLKTPLPTETPNNKTEEPEKAQEAPKTTAPPRPAPPPYGYNYENRTAAPYNYSQQSHDMNKIGKKEKEKKVVSLSVALLCIAAVFILAIVCGVLMQMYINKGVGTDKRSGMSYSSETPVSCTNECEQTKNYFFL